MDVGPFFINFLPQHGMAKLVKTVDSSVFFILFAICAVGLLGLIFDCFLLDFLFILGSKICRKSIKNQSKRRSKTR